MVAGFEDHLSGTEDGLRGQRCGVAREADFDAGFGERFNDDVDKGGTGSRRDR